MAGIKISLVASSIRSQHWELFYRSCCRSNILFEVIMVGPKVDTKIPGPNFRHIIADVKPSQCYEIGFRAAYGEVTTVSADDAEYSPHALDFAYKEWKALNNRKILGTFSTIEDGKDITAEHRFFWKDLKSPVAAPFWFIDTQFFREIGGYDRNFICGQAENDLVMRVNEAGGRVHIFKNSFVIVDHKLKHSGRSYFRTMNKAYLTQPPDGYYKKDRAVLEGIWMRNGIILNKRSKPVEKYTNLNIMTKSQGGLGHWV